MSWVMVLQQVQVDSDIHLGHQALGNDPALGSLPVSLGPSLGRGVGWPWGPSGPERLFPEDGIGLCLLTTDVPAPARCILGHDGCSVSACWQNG